MWNLTSISSVVDTSNIVNASTIAAAIFGGLSVAVSIYIAWRKKDFSRPVLMLSPGLGHSYGSHDIIERIKKFPISALIYGSQAPKNSEVILGHPYILANNSELPIFDVALQLHYASRYAMKNDDKISCITNNDSDIKLNTVHIQPDAQKSREVLIMGPIAQITYTIPILRPREKIVVFDPIKLPRLDSKNVDDIEGDYGVSNEATRKLREIGKLNAYCVIDITVLSRNCSPIVKRIRTMWFDATSEDELLSLNLDANKAFLGGKWPTPGIYLQIWPPAKRPMAKEYGELIVPNLIKIGLSKDMHFCFEDPIESDRTLIEYEMPKWIYYDLAGSIDPDEMLRRLGSRKIISYEYVNGLKEKLKILR